MTQAAAQLAKEGRPLLPIWAGAAAGIAAARALEVPPLGLVAFLLGAVALGAWCTGQEYAYRTLGPLLTQPVERSHLLRLKLAVLVPLLLLLTLVFWVAALESAPMMRAAGTSDLAARWRLAFALIPPLLGLGVAPWLAIVCRSAMAGAVFTLAVPAALAIAAEVARTAAVGFEASTLTYPPAFDIIAGGTAVAASLATVVGWRQFLRQDDVDAGPSARPGIRTDAAMPGRRTRHPAIALALKEARLYPLALAVTALYAGGWIAMHFFRLDQTIAGQSFQGIAELYGMFMAVLVGVTASAEERALGVAPSQVLLPYAFWKQWAVKSAVAVAIALAAGPALMIALETAFPLIGDAGAWPVPRLWLPGLGAVGGHGVATATLALVALHISTLNTSGLRALLLALPWCLGLLALYRQAYMAAYQSEAALALGPGGAGGIWWRNLPTVQRSDFAWSQAAGEWTGLVVLAGLVGMVIVFGLRNHRSAEPRHALAWRQLLCLGVYAAAAGVLVRAVPSAVLWYMVTH